MDFSDAIKEKLVPDFAEYGVSLEQFFVSAIVMPDGAAQYEKFMELNFRKYSDIAEAKLRQQAEVIDEETGAKKTLPSAMVTPPQKGEMTTLCSGPHLSCNGRKPD